MRHRHRRGRNAERLPWSDSLIEAGALVLLSTWERDEPLYACASKTAHRINSSVCSMMLTHLSVRASSSSSSPASDMPGGGKTFSRPSSSSCRLVVTSTTTLLLNCPDECDSSAHLSLGYSHADPSLAVISRSSHGESRGQVAPKLSRVELPSVDQFLIEAGVHRLMTPSRAHKACSLQSHLRSLKHSVIGPAHGRVHKTFPRQSSAAFNDSLERASSIDCIAVGSEERYKRGARSAPKSSMR
jgi:hypothetical protein